MKTKKTTKENSILIKIFSELIRFILAFIILRISTIASFFIVLFIVLLLGILGIKINTPESDWGVFYVIITILLSLGTSLLLSKKSKLWIVYMIILILGIFYWYGPNWGY